MNKNFIVKLNNFPAFSVASVVKSWDNDIDFFLELKILRSFNLINKNRLKNIFKRYVNDDSFWIEIEKMLNSGFISISNDLVYNCKASLDDSLLSSFLLNIYLKEFDDFVGNLIYKYNLRKNFYSLGNNSNKFMSVYFNTLKRFSPLKLEVNLNHVDNLKNIISTKYECGFLMFSLLYITLLKIFLT